MSGTGRGSTIWKRGDGVLYGKLIVVALGTIASEPQGSANQVIAQYIMEHLQEIQ